jgi:hypothetical protein
MRNVADANSALFPTFIYLSPTTYLRPTSSSQNSNAAARKRLQRRNPATAF